MNMPVRRSASDSPEAAFSSPPDLTVWQPEPRYDSCTDAWAIRRHEGGLRKCVSKAAFRKERDVNRVLKSSFLGIALAVGASTAAHASPWHHHDYDPPRREPKTAPEVDPSLAIGGLSLLGGTIAVLRARRSK